MGEKKTTVPIAKGGLCNIVSYSLPENDLPVKTGNTQGGWRGVRAHVIVSNKIF